MEIRTTPKESNERVTNPDRTGCKFTFKYVTHPTATFFLSIILGREGNLCRRCRQWAGRELTGGSLGWSSCPLLLLLLLLPLLLLERFRDCCCSLTAADDCCSLGWSCLHIQQQKQQWQDQMMGSSRGCSNTWQRFSQVESDTEHCGKHLSLSACLSAMVIIFW